MNSVIRLLITFVHATKNDFLLVSTMTACMAWTSQKAKYTWDNLAYPKVALAMQNKWMGEMDTAWKDARKSQRWHEKKPIAVK
jgi:hypothetical protein